VGEGVGVKVGVGLGVAVGFAGVVLTCSVTVLVGTGSWCVSEHPETTNRKAAMMQRCNLFILKIFAIIF
tara:strand:- start:887 stop:1093 length:207 start_codon:yes stop_codon:yes gene_type:complete